MAQVNLANDWIPLQDYHVKQVRRPVKRVQESDFKMPPPPDLWVSWSDHFLHGKRRSRLSDSVAAEHAKQQPAPSSTPSQLPPEARVTVQQAVEQVFAPLAREASSVNRRLDRMLGDCRRHHGAGRFSDAQWQQCQHDMEQIREQFARDGDTVAHWFLDHFFRVFEDLAELQAKMDNKRRPSAYKRT
ncbi:MAG: hypothetical protein HQL60_03690 [Magnetococcales bacterium]|nr:hypothetical protein [Magnetococcales bacterium]